MTTEDTQRTAIRVLFIGKSESAGILADDENLALTVCGSTDDAQTLLGREPIDVVVASLDTVEPAGIPNLRAGHPVVVVAKEEMEHRIAEALRNGADDYVLLDTHGRYKTLLPFVIQKPRRTPRGGATTDRTEWLASMVDSAHDAVFSTTVDLRILTWNVAAEELFGYTASEAIGENVSILHTDPHSDGLPEGLLQGYAARNFETTRRHKSGREIEVAVTMSPVKDRTGEIVGLCTIAREIGQRKSSEKALRESEALLRQVAEGIRDVFYILDTVEMRCCYVSPGYEEIYGRPAEALYQNPLAWMEAAHPNELANIKADFENMVKRRRPEGTGGEYRIVRPDGSVRWVEHRPYFLDDENGSSRRIAGVVTDVTERKQIEEALKDSENKYRVLVEQASDGIFLADKNGRFLDANPAGCSMLGYEREQLLGMNLKDVVTGASLKARPLRFGDLTSGAQIMIERELRRKDGTQVPVEISARMLPGGALQGIVRDITERRRAADALRNAHAELEHRVDQRTRELRQLNEGLKREVAARKKTEEAYLRSERLASIGTLAAGIAHEINNPLGSILMAADSALGTPGAPAETGEVAAALHSIKAEAKRAGRVVKSVLQFARQEESHKWPHDLADVARRARGVARDKARSKGVTLLVRARKDLPPVVMNPTEIEQVFVNLINNAVDASSEGQTVCIQIGAEGREAQIFVTDEGCGMTSKQSTRVFNPFYTTKQNEGGTGLGLSMSHGIVTAHGGTISVDSHPGRGTTITLTFPVGEADHREGDEIQATDR